MDKVTLKKELLYLARQTGLEEDDLGAHVEFVIQTGLAAFWAAHGWTWTTRPYELVCEAEAESYLLPNDFAGVRTLREKASSYGGSILFVNKERFDCEVPKPTALTAGNSKVATVFFDRAKKRWYFQAYPVPDAGMSIYIEMYTTTGSVEVVPDSMLDGLMDSCERIMYKAGSRERYFAKQNYNLTLKRLKREDGPFRGNLIEIITDAPGATGSDAGMEWWRR